MPNLKPGALSPGFSTESTFYANSRYLKIMKFGKKKMFGKIKEGVLRTTFIIDESGKIEHILKKTQTKDYAKQILSKY